MEKKQSSIDWLCNNLKSHFEHDGDLLEVMHMSFKQAKAMHKDEVENAWYNGYLHQGEMFEHENVGEEFYNETFKK